MSADACIAKKRSCNPPAMAKLQVPEIILNDIATGLIDRETALSAGLTDYLMRCAALDEEVARQYENAEKWFIENLTRVARKDKPLPKPPNWHEYAAAPETDISNIT